MTTQEETISKLGRGIRVKSQTKEVVYNVHTYFEKLHSKGKSRHH